MSGFSVMDFKPRVFSESEENPFSDIQTPEVEEIDTEENTGEPETEILTKEELKEKADYWTNLIDGFVLELLGGGILLPLSILNKGDFELVRKNPAFQRNGKVVDENGKELASDSDGFLAVQNAYSRMERYESEKKKMRLTAHERRTLQKPLERHLKTTSSKPISPFWALVVAVLMIAFTRMLPAILAGVNKIIEKINK